MFVSRIVCIYVSTSTWNERSSLYNLVSELLFVTVARSITYIRMEWWTTIKQYINARDLQHTQANNHNVSLKGENTNYDKINYLMLYHGSETQRRFNYLNFTHAYFMRNWLCSKWSFTNNFIEILNWMVSTTNNWG